MALAACPWLAEIAARARRRRALAPRRRRRGHDACPGKLLWKLDPGAVDRLAARLPAGRALISATNGKTTTAAMAAEILAPALPARAQPLRRQPRLGRRVHAARRTRTRELGLFEVDEAALPGGGAARAAARGLPRQPLPRPARPLRGARARRRRAGARRSRELPAETALVVNGGRPAGRRSRRERAPVGRRSASTTRATPRPALQHAADSKWCVRCGTPYDVRRRLRRPPRRLPLPDVRARAAAARRRRARGRAERARAVSFELVTPEGTRRVELRRAGPLQRLQRARARRRSRARSGRSLDEIAAGLQRFSAPRSAASSGSRVGDRSLLVLLIKNPAGANEVVRTLVAGGAPRAAADRAERRDRGRPRRLVDLGRRLRAAARRARAARRDRRARGRAGAAVQVRGPRRGARSRSCPSSSRRSTAGSS